jgi:signal transduction histidine kinase
MRLSPRESWARIGAEIDTDRPEPASYALRRMAGITAAYIRLATGALGAVAALIGLAPPARLAWVVPVALANCGWAVVFAVFATRRGLVAWLVAGDVLVSVALLLLQRELVPDRALPNGASWVVVIASMTMVIANLAWRPPAALSAGAVLLGAFVAGSYLAGALGASLFQVVVFTVQITATAVFMAFLRRACRAADVALDDFARSRQAAEVEHLRRAVEREHNRGLHDTVLATLTIVGTGAIRGNSPTLRRRAAADLAVIERLGHADDPDGKPENGLRPLAPMLARAVTEVPELTVNTSFDACTVPAEVADAFTGAATQALRNVAAYARTGTAALRLTGGNIIVVEVDDEGVGFDPGQVPTHRYGVREAIVGRMEAVGGQAVVESAPGVGTRVRLSWSLADGHG